VITELIKTEIESLPIDQKIAKINELKLLLHDLSPFNSEPVDCVLWVKSEEVLANDYNPNTVAPPEMRLLEKSIQEDGYTQPIVSWKINGHYEVVDGFHRNRVGKESLIVNSRILGYLPVTVINHERTDRGDRISATIRHNRARGKHQIDKMSDIVLELKNRNWKNERICRELGMEEDEVLRLCQITGLADLFKDIDFSKSWELKDSEPDDFIPLSDEYDEDLKKENKFRTVNTGDENRIFHTYDKWECYKAGFYNNSKPGMTREDCEQEFYNFLTNEDRFRNALDGVISEWKHSCEHYLTNNSMNRIAYLGQAALCYDCGIPSNFRQGYHLLSDEQKLKADTIALEYLNQWLRDHGHEGIGLDDGLTDRQSTIY